MQVAHLRQRFFQSISPGGLAGDRRGVIPASGFSFSAQKIWEVIKQTKDLDLPTHKVKLMFAGEKKVCDQIFEGVESLRDQCFVDVCGASVSTILYFGEAVARSKRSPEKLFVLLDMYETMRIFFNTELCFLRLVLQ